MEQEGAASSAPDDPTAGEADTVLDVASGIALVEPGVEQTIADTPDNPVDDTVKEEEVDFDPGDETDIVGSFLGVEVTTGDLIEDVQELDQPSSEAVPEVHAEGAASSAPLQTHGSAEASASAEPDTTTGEVAVGSSPSAPSKPPRTRGARGGKDKIYKDYRRVFYQGFEQLKAFLAEHLVSRPGRSNFILQWIDFERAPQRLQELLINWQFFRNGATIQQILCEAEFLINQVAHHVSQHGYNGEGPKLAQHIRDKTPTIESLYSDDPEEQRNYSQAWDTWQDDPVQEPIRRRVGAKSKASGEFVAKGAASSAPDRSTSVGSWVGRDLLPPPKKGKGSSKGEEDSTTPVWKPSLRGSSPAVLPLSAKVRPPPKARPQVSPAPPVRVPKQPLQPPPQQRAPAPVTQPEQYSFSIRSLKPGQITESQPLVTPGVSLSPDPSASASTTIKAAPPKGAASGAPADPDPNPDPEPELDQGPEEGEEGQEPGAREEEGEFEEDQPIEIEEVAASAQRSRVRSRERPPAVVLRGRAVRSRSPPPRHTRHHRATPPQPVEQQQRPQRISLLDRPFVLNPAVPPYPKVRFDRQGAWTQAAPARRTARTNPPLTAFSVPPDLFDYAWDPHEREEAVWRDPSSRHQVLVSNNADVIPLDEQYIATDNEEDTADPNYFPGRRRSDELDPDQSDIEDQFLARVRPPSSHRSVYLDKGGAAPSAPAEESTATSSKGAAAPSAPARSSHSKIPKGYRSSDTPSPPTSVGRRPNSAGARAWFREEPTRLEAAYPRERSPRQRKPPPAPQGPKVAPVSQAVVRGYKDPPGADKIGCTIIPEKRESKKPVLKDPPKSLAKQPSTPPPDYPPGKAPPKFGEQQQLNPPPPRPGPPSRPPPVHTVINNPRPDPPDLPKGAASSAPKAAGTSRGVAKGAPTSHRARQNYQPDEPDLSIFRRHGYNWKCHAVTEIPNAFDDRRITIGIDWHKTCTPLLLDGSFWAPTPLFAQQLREISEDYPVQFVIVSFSGWTGLDRTQWEVERFVAHCYTDLNLPFVGIQITKAPIGLQGKAASIPAINCCIFVDDRNDICNEIRRTGCRAILATGGDSWLFDLSTLLRNNSVATVRTWAARTLPKEQYSQEPPGRGRAGNYS